jgi:tripartite ATP-independent transporter DctP family solute receptor
MLQSNHGELACLSGDGASRADRGHAMPRAALTRRRALALSGAAWAGAALACPTVACAQALRLRIGHGLPANHPVHAAMQLFADELEARSAGTIATTIYPDGVIGQEVDLLSQAQAGKLDFVKASASVVERIGPAYRVFNLPFVFRDRAHWRAVVESDVGERILASTAAAGLVGLTYYEAGSRSFYAKKPIDHPDALKGLKIRVQPSPTMLRLMQLFGAEGVALGWEHVYNALRAGLVDGAENSVGALIVGRHAEVVTHYSFDEHTMVPDVFFCAAARWASFSPPQQQMVREVAAASYRHMNVLWEAFEIEMHRKCEAIGVVFTHPDKAPFIARASALKQEFADDAELKALIGRIAQS